MGHFVETDEEFEIRRKESRRKRQHRAAEQQRREDEMRATMLAFCKSKRRQRQIQTLSQTALWNVIFQYVYGRKPRDVRTLTDRLEYIWYMLQTRVLRRKLPLRPTWAAQGSTDPLWEKLFHEQKAITAFAWAQKQVGMASADTATKRTSSHIVKTA